jgi:hypothetical protein
VASIRVVLLNSLNFSLRALFLMLLWFGTASNIVAWLSAVVASDIKLAFLRLFIVIALVSSVASVIAVLAVSSKIRSRVFRASILTLVVVRARARPIVPARVLSVSAIQALPYALSYSYTLSSSLWYSYIRRLKLAFHLLCELRIKGHCRGFLVLLSLVGRIK